MDGWVIHLLILLKVIQEKFIYKGLVTLVWEVFNFSYRKFMEPTESTSKKNILYYSSKKLYTLKNKNINAKNKEFFDCYYAVSDMKDSAFVSDYYLDEL